MISALHPALAPDRFTPWLGHPDHCLFPLDPHSDRTICLRPGVKPYELSEEELDEWNNSLADVGLICGQISGCTVLAVRSDAAQEWVDDREPPMTPTLWNRTGRYYIYNYADPDHIAQLTLPMAGMAILNSGEIITYPGSVYPDGRIAHWDWEPAGIDQADFPFELFKT